MRALRIAVGVLAAAVAAPVALAVMFAGGWYLQVDGFAGLPWSVVQDRIRTYAILCAPVAFFVALAFGAPYIHRLQELGRATVLRTMFTGIVLGAVPFLIFDGYIIGMNLLLLVREPYTRETLETAARWVGLGAWCGGWSALVYWIVAIWRPADKQRAGSS